MSDADTIRRAIDLLPSAYYHEARRDARAALVALEAEHRLLVEDLRKAEAWGDKLLAERDEAINALREIASVNEDRRDDPLYTCDVARVALVRLGEQP